MEILKNRIIRVINILFIYLERITLLIKCKLGIIYKVTYSDFDKHASKVLVVKEPTEEYVELPHIHNFIKDGSMTVYFPEVAIWKFEKAMVFSDSDFVLVNSSEIIWPKRDYYNFSKNLPQDYYIYKYEMDEAYLRKSKKTRIVDVAFSLIGVHSSVWSHVLCEYIPKLYYINKIAKLEEKRLTVLVPNYGNTHINNIVYRELNKLDVDILVVSKEESIKVEKLYFMERVGRVTDHEIYVEVGDQVEPKFITDLWREKITLPLISEFVEDKDKEPTLKLFLSRNTGGHRMIKNNVEIENYFKEKGYIFVEPHKCTLKEVVNLFYQAKIVAGPFSSAFTNMIFSRPGTKSFIMCNYTRSFENFLEPIQQYFSIDIYWLLGYDLDKEHPGHTSFYISKEKMIEACRSYGID